jgi:hypothetical protein
LVLLVDLVWVGLGAGFAMMDDHELLHLVAGLVVAEVGPDDLVVEIGSYSGATAVMLHRALERRGNSTSPILSIDPFEGARNEWGNPRGSYRRYRRRIAAAGAGHRCFPLTAFSQHAHTVVPERVALLVVDGDHRYPAISADLRLYAPKVRPGGVVFVDDYSADAYPDVVRAVDEFLAADRRFEVLHRSWFILLRRRGDLGGEIGSID